MENQLKECLISKLNSNKEELIPLTFNTIKEYELTISELFGTEGFVIFTKNRAYICFDKYSNIKIYVNCDHNFSIEDFQFDHLKLNIIGQGEKDIKSFWATLICDLKNNIKLILLTTILFFSLFNLTNVNTEGLESINEVLINVISIFIGTLFVFIGFSYGDKERTLETYKKGLGDKEFFNDRYIIKLSIIIIVLLIISFALCKYPINNSDTFYFIGIFIGSLVNSKNLYFISSILTYLAIILLIVCFDTLMNYYLSRIRNKYFIDAVNELHDLRSKKNK